MIKVIIMSMLAFFSNADQLAKVSNFANSLEKYLLINTDHFKDIVPGISIKRPNAFQRWQMERTGAEATYNDITNTILLKDDYFVGDRNNYVVAGYNNFEISQRYKFFAFSSTTFHELTHADYDVSINGSGKSMEYFLNGKITPWFSKNFSEYNSKIATHELFGYTAGDSVNYLYQRIMDLMLAHGIRYPALECFSEEVLVKIKKRLNFENEIEFQKLFPNIDFTTVMTPNYVFVKGQDLNIKQANFPKEYRRELFNYFVETYDLPIDMDDLVNKLNKSHFKKLLQKCYKNIK